jgi:hypothetical protein
MVSLAQLVDDSLLRHGIDTTPDPRRLMWSEWFHIESCFSFLRVPDRGGMYALGEEVIAPGETTATAGRRMLAIFRLGESEQLGLTMGRLFLPGAPEANRLQTSRCFARYAVIEDKEERSAVAGALQRWMAASAQVAIGIQPAHSSSNNEDQIGLAERFFADCSDRAVP